MTRCPRCGATNPDDASWCSQCFTTLGEQPVAPAEPEAADPLPAAPGAPTGGAAQPPPETGLRRGQHGLEWVCVACESVNPIEASHCTACGLPFTTRFAVAEARPAVDWEAARTASLLAPGLGHLRAGRPGSGVARLVLFGIWALGGILVLLGAGTAGLPVAVPLLLGALVVHVGTQLDVRALQRGRPELLAGRALLWLVVGVTMLVVVGAAVGLGTATTGSPDGLGGA